MQHETPCWWLLGAALVLALSAGCSDDTTAPPGRAPHSVSIPVDMSLEEAVADAVPGDTLVFVLGVLVTEPVVIASEKTPLYLVSSKGGGGVSAAGSGALLHFVAPKNGTRITELAFGGGDPAILVDGGAGLLVEGCNFAGGTVQVQATGGGLTVAVDGCFLENAGAFSIQTLAGARTNATSNTIVHAGDCGIYIGGGPALVQNCIVWNSANYAIACQGGSLADGSGCNDTFASGTDEYLNCTPNPETDVSLDPLFCDAPNGDYSLRAESPCAPGNSVPGCGLIGAFLATTNCSAAAAGP